MPNDPKNANQLKRCGCVGCSHALLLHLQVFRDMSFKQALGWSVWPCVLAEFDMAFLSKTNEAVGMPSRNLLPPVVLNLLVFIASQTNPSWAGTSLEVNVSH